MAKTNYPTRYDLTEVLNTLQRSFLNDFAQERGIFMTHLNHPELADELANLYLENEDLEKIRAAAYQKSTNHALSGFIIKSSNKDFSLKNIYQYIFENRLGKPGQEPKPPRLVDPEKNIYKASFEYRKIKPGRIEFLQDETTSFDFYMEDKGNGTWQVEVDSNRSTDSKELQALLNVGLVKNEVELDELEQDFLTPEKSISFFDDLVTQGMSAEWRISDIKHLTLKKGGEPQTREDEALKEPDEEQLVGISQAVLEGKGLRENFFVKQSVKSGYRFNAMTYEFENLKTPDVLVIKAEFKGRPKVFEVSIVSASENFDISLSRRPAELDAKENRMIRSIFWNNARTVYLMHRSPKK